MLLIAWTLLILGALGLACELVVAYLDPAERRLSQRLVFKTVDLALVAPICGRVLGWW